ncbi:MAG: M23 family metallopeptidase [candidate division NC10 bacterium]|nr:M23 family metallopeptidase [candidate division NC10 bacterium]
MAEKGYTILVLSDTPSRARQWHLSERGLRVALFGGALAILTIASLVIYSLTVQLDVAEHARLRETVKAQRRVATRLETLAQEVTRLRTFDHQIRRLAGMEEVQSLMAMGGGTLELGKALAAGEQAEYEQLVERLYQDLQRLEREVALRTESLEAVTTYLTQQKNRLAATPSIWPTQDEGYVSSSYGHRASPFTGRRQTHTGIDIAAPRGTSILAAADGVVTFSGRMAGYGRVIVVTHGFGFKTFYGHNQKNKVRKGERVKRGQVIGTVGNSGYSTGSHLHYEVLVKDRTINPLKYIVDEGRQARARQKK